jgi:hypothetical protein
MPARLTRLLPALLCLLVPAQPVAAAADYAARPEVQAFVAEVTGWIRPPCSKSSPACISRQR